MKVYVSIFVGLFASFAFATDVKRDMADAQRAAVGGAPTTEQALSISAQQRGISVQEACVDSYKSLSRAVEGKLLCTENADHTVECNGKTYKQTKNVSDSIVRKDSEGSVKKLKDTAPEAKSE